MEPHNRVDDRSLRRSLKEYSRGILGGLIFSLPLLYTMEVWWAGFSADPLALLLYVGGTFLLLLGYNRYAGLHADATWLEVIIDSVEEMGIGIVLSAFVLWVLHRVRLDMPATEITGRVVVEAMTVAIGVSIGTSQLGERDGRKREGVQDGGPEEDPRRETSFWGQLAIAVCGAVLFGANVAPTEEIQVLAFHTTPPKLLLTCLLTILLGGVALYYAELSGAPRLSRQSASRHIIAGTVLTYAVALSAAFIILTFFGRFDDFRASTVIPQLVILSVAGMMGASVGRLLLQ